MGCQDRNRLPLRSRRSGEFMPADRRQGRRHWPARVRECPSGAYSVDRGEGERDGLVERQLLPLFPGLGEGSFVEFECGRYLESGRSSPRSTSRRYARSPPKWPRRCEHPRGRGGPGIERQAPVRTGRDSLRSWRDRRGLGRCVCSRRAVAGHARPDPRRGRTPPVRRATSPPSSRLPSHGPDVRHPRAARAHVPDLHARETRERHEAGWPRAPSVRRPKQ